MKTTKSYLTKKLSSTIICMIFALGIVLAQFTTAFALQSGTTGDVQWTLSDDGTLTVTGTGSMADYTQVSETPWYESLSDIKSVVIGEGVTKIGAYCFADCTNIASVQIPTTLYTIADFAFYGCTSLTEVTLPQRIHEVGYGAFGSTGLTKVNVLSRVVKYTENDSYENAVTFPESAVFYCGYSLYTDIYCDRNKRQLIRVDDYMITDIDNGESTYDFVNNKYGAANLWKASKSDNISSDDIMLDYTFTIDADKAKNEYNYTAPSQNKEIGSDINNGGEISLEISLGFETNNYSTDNISTNAYYGYTETDPIGRTNENYLNWKLTSEENPYVTITSDGSIATVRVQGKVKDIFSYTITNKPYTDYREINALSLSVVVSGETYISSSSGTYLNSLNSQQLEYNYTAWYDIHRKDLEVTNLGPRTLNTASTVKLWDMEEDSSEEYMEPSKSEYVWNATFSRISREYVEELDRCPGDAGFLEEYNGITYGSIDAEYDAGTDPTIRLSDFITEENKDFIHSLVGVKPSGIGGEVMIFPMICTATLTYPDGETKIVDVDMSDECTFIVRACMHACNVCGLCTETEKTTPCNTIDWMEVRCYCDEPSESIVVTTPATEDEVSFENNTWAYEPTIEVEFVNVEQSAESAYIDEIDKEIPIDDTVMLFEVSLYADGMPYTMNQWGGDEENISVTIKVGTENATLLKDGEAELIHIGSNGAETVPCESDTDAGTITFITNSLSPFAIVKKSNTDCRHYGRTFLNETQAKVYDNVDMAIKNAEASVKIDVEYGLKYADIKLIMEMVTADHPDYFWYKGSFTYRHTVTDNIIVEVIPKYDIDGHEVTKEDIEPYKAKFDARIKEIITEMKTALPEATDYEKALWIHDKVAIIITYKEGKNHQTAYGALIDGEAVCAGYAKLYQNLLIEADIPVWAIKGNSINPLTGTSESHEWNIMWLDGNCVYTDVTWDDQGVELFHVYFARDLNAMSPEHVPDSEIYADKVPTCTPGKCDTYNYFEKEKPEYAYSGELTVDFLVDVMQTKTEGKTYIMTVYDTEASEFYDWFTNENLNKIINQAYAAGKIPAGSYSIAANSMGHEGIGVENHLMIYVFQSDTGFTVYNTDKTVTVDMSISRNDYSEENKDESGNTLLKVGLVFYDESGTAIKFATEEVNPNEIYKADIPEGADTFKAILINTYNLKPLCVPGKLNLK